MANIDNMLIVKAMNLENGEITLVKPIYFYKPTWKWLYKNKETDIMQTGKPTNHQYEQQTKTETLSTKRKQKYHNANVKEGHQTPIKQTKDLTPILEDEEDRKLNQT